MQREATIRPTLAAPVQCKQPSAQRKQNVQREHPSLNERSAKHR